MHTHTNPAHQHMTRHIVLTLAMTPRASSTGMPCRMLQSDRIRKLHISSIYCVVTQMIYVLQKVYAINLCTKNIYINIRTHCTIHPVCSKTLSSRRELFYKKTATTLPNQRFPIGWKNVIKPSFLPIRTAVETRVLQLSRQCTRFCDMLRFR